MLKIRTFERAKTLRVFVVFSTCVLVFIRIAVFLASKALVPTTRCRLQLLYYLGGNFHQFCCRQNIFAPQPFVELLRPPSSAKLCVEVERPLSHFSPCALLTACPASGLGTDQPQSGGMICCLLCGARKVTRVSGWRATCTEQRTNPHPQ